MVTIILACSTSYVLERKDYGTEADTEKPGGATRQSEPAVPGKHRQVTEWWLWVTYSLAVLQDREE